MENKPVRKYQRREFLKTTGKGIIGAGIGGLIGYFTGRTYREGRDAYRKNVKPYVEKGKEMIDETEKAGDKAKDWYNKNFNKKEYEKQKQEEAEIEAQKRESEKTSRRGFLSKYFHLFNEHPVSTGTTTGAVIGGAISTTKLLPQYLEKKKIARLKDEHIDYGNRINNLENKSKQEYKELRENIENEFEEEIGKMNKNNSELENKLKDSSLETPIAMIISSVFLMILSVISEGAKYSGFLISESNISNIKPLSIITLILSLTFVLIGLIKLKKTKI